MEEKKFHSFSDTSTGAEETPLQQEPVDEEEIYKAGDAGEEKEPWEELLEKVAGLEQEKSAIKNRLLRLQADFDNFRKRARHEKEEMIGLANFNLVQKLLPVIDNLERALSALQEGPSDIREGLEMIKKHFMEILQGEGVALIESVGQHFDPRFHEAVLREEESVHPPDTVVDELQKGYIMNERVLRASKVKVSVE